MRKLATIRRILDVFPIDGADEIEAVQIDGWRCVARKGKFKAGDLCIYFEIDSFLPIRPEFEFLRSGCLRTLDDKQGFRLKSKKIRGCISQGLVMTLDELNVSGNEGDDLSDLLGVEKYELPESGETGTKPKKNDPFPTFIPKTDQERIQNIPKGLLEKWKDLEFEVTEKLDGTSFTVGQNNGEFFVCSRNHQLDMTEFNLYTNLVRKHNLNERLLNLGLNMAIQGELVGPGIQGNKYKLEEQTLFVFDIFDIDRQRYVTNDERSIILNCFFPEIKHVPILTTRKITTDIVELLEFSGESNSKLNEKTIREGVVFKSTELVNGRTVSFKVINNKFLLKYE